MPPEFYDLDSPADYERWLIDQFTLNPPLATDDNAGVLYNEDGTMKHLTPEEAVAKMKVTFSKSWPNGVDQPPVVDPISQFGHFWINYQRGHDMTGGKIEKGLQSQPTPISDQPWVLDGLVLNTPPDVKMINEKLDKIIGLVTVPVDPPTEDEKER